MTDRTATTTWTGGLAKGEGKTELTSSGVGTFDVSFPARAAKSSDLTTPEEMLAAAHSSCFSMALSNEIGEAGGTPKSIQTKATVTLDTDSLSISKVALVVTAAVDGLDDAGFEKAAKTAKDNCPVSKLFSGNTEITLDASLS